VIVDNLLARVRIWLRDAIMEIGNRKRKLQNDIVGDGLKIVKSDDFYIYNIFEILFPSTARQGCRALPIFNFISSFCPMKRRKSDDRGQRSENK
jgi:hypothetical protein